MGCSVVVAVVVEEVVVCVDLRFLPRGLEGGTGAATVMLSRMSVSEGWDGSGSGSDTGAGAAAGAGAGLSCVCFLLFFLFFAGVRRGFFPLGGREGLPMEWREELRREYGVPFAELLSKESPTRLVLLVLAWELLRGDRRAGPRVGVCDSSTSVSLPAWSSSIDDCGCDAAST